MVWSCHDLELSLFYIMLFFIVTGHCINCDTNHQLFQMVLIMLLLSNAPLVKEISQVAVVNGNQMKRRVNMVSSAVYLWYLAMEIKNQCLMLFGGFPPMHKKLKFGFSKYCIKTESSEPYGV